MSTFDPNQPGVANGSYFALPYTTEEADIVLVSVPWDVTTSYRAGTHRGPGAIIDASVQVDLFNPRVPDAWKIPIATLPANDELLALNKGARMKAEEVIAAWEAGTEPEEAGADQALEEVNQACARMNRIVY
ncbi:MAG: arginase family protein, partial [Bacteroidales bacterium]|nr:arginase family protein [Bacteroidales bacterium]